MTMQTDTDLGERLAQAQAQLADALWRERVAECAIRMLKDYGTVASVRRRYGLNPDRIVLVGGDPDRPITAGDVLYILEKVR